MGKMQRSQQQSVKSLEFTVSILIGAFILHVIASIAVYIFLVASGNDGVDTTTPVAEPTAVTVLSAPPTNTAPRENSTTETAAPSSIPAPVHPTASATAFPPDAGSAVLAVLDSLTVETEHEGPGYERREFEHQQGHLCDFPGIDPYTGTAFDADSCDVDHIVAAREAFESGAWRWDVHRRKSFGNDALNLVPSRDCVNRSKGARDMAEWSGKIGSGDCRGLTVTAQGRCFAAWKMVEVKNKFGLSVDHAEKGALAQVLENCLAEGQGEPPTPS